MENTTKSGAAAVKSYNKHLFAWVFAFLLGKLGVDRFCRGQVALGLVKLGLGVLGMILMLVGSVSVVGNMLDLTQNLDAASSAEAAMNIATGVVGSVLNPYYILGIAMAIANNVWAFVDWIISLVKAYGAAFKESKMVEFDAEGKYIR